MEDDWTEYYENISKIENYYDEFDSQKHRNGFVLRKDIDVFRDKIL